jgi:hypothetical protein
MNGNFASEKELRNERLIATRKVVLSLLGPIGIAIEESIFNIGERIRDKRFREFVEILSKKVEEIDTKTLTNEYFLSEEFYDLNVKIIQSVISTSEKIKYDILSNLFVKSINSKYHWENDIDSIFVKIINDFSINHFLVLRYLLTKQFILKIPSYEFLHNDFCKYINNSEIDKYQFRFYCREIENKSLIRFSLNIDELGNEGGGYTEAEDSAKIESIILTSFGEKFISLLDSYE